MKGGHILEVSMTFFITAGIFNNDVVWRTAKNELRPHVLPRRR